MPDPTNVPPAPSAAPSRALADAAPRNITPVPLAELRWGTDAETARSLRVVYEHAEAHAGRAIAWYFRKKAAKSVLSRGLRIAAIVLTTLGGLAPIVTSGGLVNADTARVVGQAGYVLLGLAAAAVALDRFFGYSSAWIRYIVASQNLQRALDVFRLDWAMATARLAGAPPPGDQVQLLLQRVKDFVVLVDTTVAEETQEWVVEFRSNLAEVERTARAQLEATRPGGIDVTVTNGMDAADGFTVYLDGMRLRTVRGTRHQIEYVPPGAHKVRVVATVGGREVEASELAAVPPGEVSKVTLALPVETAQP
jgi:hypothetical protein